MNPMGSSFQNCPLGFGHQYRCTRLPQHPEPTPHGTVGSLSTAHSTMNNTAPHHHHMASRHAPPPIHPLCMLTPLLERHTSTHPLCSLEPLFVPRAHPLFYPLHPIPPNLLTAFMAPHLFSFHPTPPSPTLCFSFPFFLFRLSARRKLPPVPADHRPTSHAYLLGSPHLSTPVETLVLVSPPPTTPAHTFTPHTLHLSSILDTTTCIPVSSHTLTHTPVSSQLSESSPLIPPALLSIFHLIFR